MNMTFFYFKMAISVNENGYFEEMAAWSQILQVLVEYCSSGEDVSVNTVIMLRNWGAILADLRSEATEEARIAPQFRGMMTVLTGTSDPELLYSHC